MKIGVVIFPGSNCDRDLIEVLSEITQSEVQALWHKQTDLNECTHVFLPGGFSYGDYLRSGAIAKLSPIMQAVKKHAADGGFVMGICNGFQILCEAGLLPGALLRNTSRKFICKDVYLKANLHSNLLKGIVDKSYCIPIAHGEGRYYADDATMASLHQNNQVLFTYTENPNGSLDAIAGITNKEGNVIGMMPHPERTAADFLHSTDGREVLEAIFASQGVELANA
jgi:phosphoribosylformylglycinamidine synthase I